MNAPRPRLVVLLILALTGLALGVTPCEAKDKKKPVKLTPQERTELRKLMRRASFAGRGGRGGRGGGSRMAGRREDAIAKIGKMGAKAKDAVKVLAKLLKDSEEGVRMASADALGDIGADGERSALAALASVLGGSDEPLTAAACRSLGRAGEDAAPVAKRLFKLLESPSPEVRIAALAALGQTGPGKVKKPDQPIRALLDDADPFVRFESRVTLVSWGHKDKAFVASFVEVLKNKKNLADRRMRAADALGAIGEPAAAAVPELIAGFQEQNEGAFNPAVPYAKERKAQADKLRARCARALGLIGKPAAEAIPALEAEKDDENLKEAVAEALERIKG